MRIDGLHAFPTTGPLRFGEILCLACRKRSEHPRSLFARQGVLAMRTLWKPDHIGTFYDKRLLSTTHCLLCMPFNL